jgi:Asp-tRNA(Asn)/Glu-tRNA(Gln) amidotransferase A subunit family amidase
LASTGSYTFNGMWTLLHTPCINVPGLTGPLGLPVGLTLTGPRFSDRRLLAIASAVGAAFAAG